MKNTKQSLIKIIFASSLVINFVMLGAFAYVAAIDINARLETAKRAPVFIYVPKIAEGQVAATTMGLSSTR